MKMTDEINEEAVVDNAVGSRSDITPVDVSEEMRRSYLDYAMSVIVSRALPDVRDGLKPVHRRIIYSMYENGYDYNRPFRKSARIVGDVLGKYHPHGDFSVYEAMVRMAQPFSMRVPMIDGQGNFGSMDGDSAAAMRYTEARLAKVAHALIEDIDKDTVDFIIYYTKPAKTTVPPENTPGAEMHSGFLLPRRMRRIRRPSQPPGPCKNLPHMPTAEISPTGEPMGDISHRKKSYEK